MSSKFKPKCRKPLSQRKKHKGNVSAFTKSSVPQIQVEIDLDHIP